VFLSHSARDRWIAGQMMAAMEGCHPDVVVFLDERDIGPGDSIPDEIREAIARCDEMVVLLTARSIHRTWVLAEIGAAWALEKKIVAVLYDVEPDKMPDVIKLRKAVDLNDFDRYVLDLATRVPGGGA
jgi:hypothetical protein